MPHRSALAAALLALTLALPTLAAARLWTIDDILGVRQVSDPQAAPDGSAVAYVVQELNAARTDYQTDVWTIPVTGGEARRLTTFAGNDLAPRWSPDARRIAFLSDRPQPGAKDAVAEGRRQVWVLGTEGGEATPLTHAEGGVSSFQWSPDGSFVAYVSSEPKSAARRAREAERDDAWFPESTWVWDRLWRIDVATGRTTPLTDASQHVTGFTIAPDGRRVCYSAQSTPGLTGWFGSDLWIVPAAGGRATPLVRRPGTDTDPAWSPDGRWIAFVSQAGREPEWFTNDYLCIVSAAGGEPVVLTPNFDERVNGAPGSVPGSLVWSEDSSFLWFQSLWKTGAHLFTARADEPEVKPFTFGDVVCTSPNRGGDVLVFLRQTPRQPADVWVQEQHAGQMRRLTLANPQIRDALLEFPKTVMRWKSADGLDIDGILISPPSPRPGAPAPLLVCVHGGPAAAHVNSFTPGNRDYPWPLFLQDGWAVLMPNPRGSGGYGETFRAANVRDWGGRDADDVMEGVNTLIRLGLVDSTRMAVCGWSYGGFLTATLVTKTTRFRAAVVGAGPTNLAGMGTAPDVPDFERSYFQAWPWQDPQVLVDHSPLFHVDRVKTPTALVHGERDDAVPVSQAFQFWHGLRRVGVPTELMVLPRQGHHAREPKLQRATMQFQYDWITRWTLGGGLPKPAERPLPRPIPVSRPGAGSSRTKAPRHTGH